MARHADREPSNKLRLQAILDEVAGHGLSKQFIGAQPRYFRSRRGHINRTAGGRRQHSGTDALVHAGKRTADNKENVPGINRLGLSRSIATHRSHGVLDLRIHVIGRDERHVTVLHQLEQIGLYTPTGNIPTAALAAGR